VTNGPRISVSRGLKKKCPPQVFGWMSHYMPGYMWLVERSRRLGYDSRSIIDRYEEHVEDVLVNVLYALSLRALARLSGDAAYDARARRTRGCAAPEARGPGSAVHLPGGIYPTFGPAPGLGPGLYSPLARL
jgi:hypothetical protein